MKLGGRSVGRGERANEKGAEDVVAEAEGRKSTEKKGTLI